MIRITQYQLPAVSTVTHTHTKHIFFLFWGQLSVTNSEMGGSEKNEWMGGLKQFQPQIFDSGDGAYYVPCQKRLCKIKYSSKVSISNVEIGLF